MIISIRQSLLAVPMHLILTSPVFHLGTVHLATGRSRQWRLGKRRLGGWNRSFWVTLVICPPWNYRSACKCAIPKGKYFPKPPLFRCKLLVSGRANLLEFSYLMGAFLKILREPIFRIRQPRLITMSMYSTCTLRPASGNFKFKLRTCHFRPKNDK